MVIQQTDYNYKITKNFNIIIFGENHFDYDNSILFITNEVKKIKPKLLMHELLTPNDIVNKTEALKRLKNNDIYNKDNKAEIPDIYELIKDINCLGVGYELPLSIIKKEKGINNQFLIREYSALMKLNLYSNIFNKICFVIGDTHLRSKPIEDLLTSSPIYEWAKNKKNVLLIRTKNNEVLFSNSFIKNVYFSNIDLKPFNKTHINDIVKILKEKNVSKYISDSDNNLTADNYLKKIKENKNKYFKTIYLTALYEGKIIGSFNISMIDPINKKAYIIYYISDKYQGKNFGKELLKKAINWIKDNTNIHKIIANIETNNKASIALVKSQNFKKVGLHKEHFYKNKKFYDIIEFEKILKY